MAKKISQRERIQNIFNTAPEVEAKILLYIAGDIVRQRFPESALAVARRGRGPGKKAKAAEAPGAGAA